MEGSAPESVGTQLTRGDLVERLHAAARTATAVTSQERSADAAEPFTLAAFVARPAPAERAPAGAAPAATAAERAEVEAVERAGGDPVLGRDKQ